MPANAHTARPGALGLIAVDHLTSNYIPLFGKEIKFFPAQDIHGGSPRYNNFRAISSSAICTAFRAAPLRN